MKHFSTQRQLAKALGRSPSVVCRYLRRDDWPVRRRPPWSSADVATIRSWAAANLQEDPAAGEHYTRAELARLERWARENVEGYSDLVDAPWPIQKDELDELLVERATPEGEPTERQ